MQREITKAAIRSCFEEAQSTIGAPGHRLYVAAMKKRISETIGERVPWKEHGVFVMSSSVFREYRSFSRVLYDYTCNLSRV